MEQDEKLAELVAKSRKNDVVTLLNAKNKAQQDVYDAASSKNLAALDRATAMLEKAMGASTNIKNWQSALEYLKDDCGRKVGKTKLFEDIKAARLKKQADGSFTLRDLDRYAASLPTTGTPDVLVRDASKRMKEKEEQEIRRIRAIADREEFALSVKKGQYILKEQVHLELAARAVTLSASIRTAFESSAFDILATVDGNPKKVLVFTQQLEKILDEALNEYSRDMEFEVTFTEEKTEDRHDSDQPV